MSQPRKVFNACVEPLRKGTGELEDHPITPGLLAIVVSTSDKRDLASSVVRSSSWYCGEGLGELLGLGYSEPKSLDDAGPAIVGVGVG